MNFLKAFRLVLPLALVLILSACVASIKPLPPTPVATLTFQNGQTTTIKLMRRDAALEGAFLQWVQAGVYTQTPVYRQLPGIFVLTGKPRLAGTAFVPGASATTPAPREAGVGEVGLVIHADGTVGPELVLIYGHALTTCCQAPANIHIGAIINGKSELAKVQRGDNLTSIAIQP